MIHKKSTTIKKLQRNLHHWLLLFCYTQLMISLVMLPVLVHWGLPFSLMSFVGNLIFLPILILFILFSSILFFTELLGIPNSLAVSGVNTLVDWWHYVLSYGSSRWLIGFAHPGKLVLVAMFVITVIVIYHLRVMNITKQLMLMLVFLLLLCSTLAFLSYKKSHRCYVSSGSFHVMHHGNKHITLIDDGYFNKKHDSDSAVLFELRPYLTKKFGTVVIKRLVLPRPCFRTFQAAASMVHIFNIREVCLPYFDGNISKRAWGHFFALKRLLKERDVRFSRKDF